MSTDPVFLVSLTQAIIGGFLLWASRRPTTYSGVVPLILVLELVAGIVKDLYLIFTCDYPFDAVCYGFVARHFVIIANR